ncbi:MAG: sodium:solute symporter family transporter [Planctomycetota bacterium]|jgi:Na+/proline symporter
MGSIDYGIIVIYFIIVIGLGFWYQKRASKNLESYFLGSKTIHWLPLAMSGSVSNFDITGTMWIVSILFILGMRSMWHHWMWGVLMGAFFLAFMGKWVRRSNVMTAAEWMKTRFADDSGGRLARTAYALMAILTQASFIGYAYQGIGKFASVYIPLESLAQYTSVPWLRNLLTIYEPDCLAVIIISITTLYVILGGLYSVVVTDVIQTVILTVASIFIAYLAWSRLTPDLLTQLPADWTSLTVPWRIEKLAGTQNAHFEFFGALVIVWVLKGLLMNAGGPAQMYDFQRFLAARNPTDAAKVGAAWSFFLIVRWAMAAGITLLALTAVTGVTDPEKVMPQVLQKFLPVGIRGIVIAGLLAAFMSTFSSTVNSGASFIVRDIWQPYFRPNAATAQSIRFSHIATILLVLTGIAIGLQARSIAEIWSWIMMALGAGVIIPNVLRWYWWRMNGYGYAFGMLGGILLSLVVLFFPNIPIYYMFPLICTASLVMSIAVSLATKPVDHHTLINFYETIRPFGLWKPIRCKAQLSPEELSAKSERLSITLLNVILGMLMITGLYLFPMYLVGHWYAKSIFWFALAAAATITLKYTWYQNLPNPGSPPKNHLQ